MEITLKRTIRKPEFTIGELKVNGNFHSYVLEDADRGLHSGMSLSEIASIKIPAETAIPSGRYEVVLNFSNRFQKLLPLLLDVPGFSGVRIHSGNTTAHTEGCLLPGNKRNLALGEVYESRDATNRLISLINAAVKKEKVFITIS
jgi:hypothetical protein